MTKNEQFFNPEDHLPEDTKTGIAQLRAMTYNAADMHVASAVFESKDGVPRLKTFTLVNPKYPNAAGTIIDLSDDS